MIRVYPNIISGDALAALDIPHTFHKFIGQNDAVEKLIMDYLPIEADSVGVASINVDDLPIKLHLDQMVKGETHKVLVYLTEGPGTEFCDERGKMYFHVAASIGTMVIFDIHLHHQGEDFDGVVKRTIGLRIRIHH